MTRRDFEIRAAEFFLCCDNVEEQYDELLDLENDDIPRNKGISIFEPFKYNTSHYILMQINKLADNYEEFYKMTNEM